MGNIATTTLGKVWTVRLIVNNARNIGVQFDHFNLLDSAVMYLYDSAKTELTGPVEKSLFPDSTASMVFAPINGSSVIIYIIEKNNFSTFLSTVYTSEIMAGYQDWDVFASSDSASS